MSISLLRPYGEGQRAGPTQTGVAFTANYSAKPQSRVLLHGASHSHQWLPTLVRVAKRHNWHLDARYHSACDVYDADQSSHHHSGYPNPDPACLQRLREEFTALTRGQPYDAAIVLGTYFSKHSGSREVAFDRHSSLHKETRGKLEAAGVHLIALRDTPRFTFRPTDCLAEQLGLRHSFQQAQITCSRRPLGANREAAQQANVSNWTFIDLNDFICPWDVKGDATAVYEERHCPSIVGNVPIYRDNDHMNRFYADSLAPALERALKRAGPSTRLKWMS